MKKELKTKIKSFRLTEEQCDKLSNLAKVRNCSESRIIEEALLTNSNQLDTQAIYKTMLNIYNYIETTEKTTRCEAKELREELMNVCLLLNS